MSDFAFFRCIFTKCLEHFQNTSTGCNGIAKNEGLLYPLKKVE